MKIQIISLAIAALLVSGCGNGQKQSSDPSVIGTVEEVTQALPVTGTFINLPYQDVRNKYTNPPHIDCTDPGMWKAKVAEMKQMGMEYLVFMSVANEEKAYYPSKLMDRHYPKWRQSPVDAIIDAAQEHGMKVFMSTGWAKDQDDNLRDPKIKGRQIEMMTELAGLYGGHPAFHGWYLPVEDCFGPVLTDYAVEAVNALTARARELTPHARIMISPYGIFNSDFEDPRYEQQIARLTVDIIAYQDEIGCVRERYPLTRLRENWKKLRAIHDKTGIEMWANCESFAWEKGTNDRSSALVPAPFSRFLSQQVAATAGGAETIISFIFCGLVEDPSSPYQLGQPHWSAEFHKDYMDWMAGSKEWKILENSFDGNIGSGLRHTVEYPVDGSRFCDVRLSDGQTAGEDLRDDRWVRFKAGKHELYVNPDDQKKGVNTVMIRMLNSHKDGIIPPSKVYLRAAEKDGEEHYRLVGIADTPVFPNTGHDAFIDHVLFDALEACNGDLKNLKIEFTCETEVYIDEIIINPEI